MPGASVGPERQEEVIVFADGHAAHHVGERRAEEDGEKRAREEEQAVKEGVHQSVLRMAAQLNADAAQNQQPEDDHEGKIEAAESRGIKKRKGEEQCASGGEQPDFIAVPYRANGAQRLLAFRLSFCDEEIEDTDAEVIAVKNHVGRQHRSHDPKPQCSHGSS